MNCSLTTVLCSPTRRWQTERNYTIYYPSLLIPVQLKPTDLILELHLGDIPIKDKCSVNTPLLEINVDPVYVDERTNSTLVYIQETEELSKFLNGNHFFMQLTTRDHLQCITGPMPPYEIVNYFTLVSGKQQEKIAPTLPPVVNSDSYSSGVFVGFLIGSTALIIFGFLFFVCVIRRKGESHKPLDLSKVSMTPFKSIIAKTVPLPTIPAIEVEAPAEGAVEEVGPVTLERSQILVNDYLETMVDEEVLDPYQFIPSETTEVGSVSVSSNLK